MRNFIYKLIFPDCGKFYFGRAANCHRYSPNRPNEPFRGPHHNPEVQALLDAGEFCFFRVVKEFSSHAKMKDAEEAFLLKVWPKEEDRRARPWFLLNRSRSVGFDFDCLSPEQRKSISEKISRAQSGRKKPWLSDRLREWHKNNSVSPDFCGKPWKEGHPRRHWSPDELFEIVEQRLIAADWSLHWGRAKLAKELNISPATIKRMARRVRQKHNKS